MKPRNRLALLLVLALGVSGCKEVLYSGLTENEANEMVAILAASGVEASRSRDKKGIYELSVAGEDVAASVVILGERGYPKQQFETLGEVFSADGIIGTPFEQNARFIHAMNEELSHTISSIAGIREARVLITAPTKGRYDRTAPPASASVTIQHEAWFDPAESTSKIKQIVAYSVANLDYDNVAVLAFPVGSPGISDPSVAEDRPADDVSGAATSGTTGTAPVRLAGATGWLSESWLWQKIGGLLLLIGAGAFIYDRRQRARKGEAG
jgi:type III secretion protein J